VRTGAIVLCGWGAALIGVAALGVLVFGLDALPAALLGSAGAASVASGVVAGVLGRCRARPLTDEAPRLLVDSSLATFALVAGFVNAVVGAGAVGASFFWPGVGLMALGAGGLVRERLATRRVMRDLERGGAS